MPLAFGPGEAFQFDWSEDWAVIHRAAKSIKLGQVGVKLSFHVKDVAAFAAQAKLRGLVFGAVHEANGYAFANAKDLDKNSISISSRAHRASAVEGD